MESLLAEFLKNHRMSRMEIQRYFYFFSVDVRYFQLFSFRDSLLVILLATPEQLLRIPCTIRITLEEDLLIGCMME